MTRLSRRVPLRPVSPKRRKQASKRRACVKAVQARSGGRCEAMLPGCSGRGDHVHELKRRSQGGDPHDPAGCINVCFNCHRRIHDAPGAAYDAGLLLRRNER